MDQKNKTTTHHWKIRLLHALYEIFSVVLAVVDVVCDILVAQQFHSDGMAVWFYITVAIMVNANFVYTLITVEHGLLDEEPLFGRLGDYLHNRLKGHKLVGRLILYPLVFPLAQFTPILNWLLTTFLPAEIDRNSSPLFPSATVKEDVQVSAVTGDVEQHYRRHYLLFVETLAEAVPQSIVQVLAVGINHRITALQVWSIALSVSAIVSKAHTLSRSFLLPVFVSKFCLIAHDIFALFFAFSSLFAVWTGGSNTAPCLPLVEYHATPYSCILQWLMLAFGTVAIGVALAYGAVYVYCRTVTHTWSEERVLNTFLVALLTAPLIVAGCTVKFTAVVFAMRGLEPSTNNAKFLFPLYSRLYAMANGTTGGSFERKMRFITMFFATQCERMWLGQRGPERLQGVATCRHARRIAADENTPLSMIAESKPDENPELALTQNCLKSVGPTVPQSVYLCLTCARPGLCDSCVRECHANHRVEFNCEMPNRCECGPRCTVKYFRALPGADSAPPASTSSSTPPAPAAAEPAAPTAPAPARAPTQRHRVRDPAKYEALIAKAQRTCLVVLAVAWAPMTLYALLYPVLILLTRAHPLNAVHVLLLLGMVLSLPAGFGIAFRAWPHYLWFLRHCHIERLLLAKPVDKLPPAEHVVQAYYTSNADEVLEFALRDRFPPGVLQLIGLFTTRSWWPDLRPVLRVAIKGPPQRAVSSTDRWRHLLVAAKTPHPRR